ncbi:M1 family aminopeptidase [Telmatobacter bradus]|uniref:M1 family aminopeptidase n=1 Tax=Telmatobacter bradus TaxID=474953 RepID=UPI003B4339DF
MDLTPHLADQTVSGSETILVQSTANDLRTIAFTANALTIDSATLDGLPVSYATEKDALTFALPAALDLHHTATLRIVYHGTPRQGVTFAADSVYTSYDACSWMICSENTPGDKAVFSLDLHVPAGMFSLASGRLTKRSKTTDGGTIDHWRNTRPYSAYLYDFAIGKFVAAQSHQYHAKLLYLSNVASPQEMAQDFTNTGAMVQFLSQKAGLDLPSRSYTQLLVAGDEAQEASSYSILGKENIDPKDDWAIVHELAHQWWGNLVTCATWKDFWLNEGITVYMTAAWKEHQYGHAAYEAELDVARRRVAKVRKIGWDKPLAFDGEYPSIGVRRSVQYSKGALFMERLRSELGDQAFWAGLRCYTREHAGGTVTSIDLEHAMEKASGRDLSALFAEWVFGK